MIQDLEVITGSMYSGKSEELIRRVKRALYAKLKVQVFKPSIDDRYSREEVVSHNGNKIYATLINNENPWELLDYLQSDTEVCAIDEVQFFSAEIIPLILEIKKRGIKVIVAGLDLDFRGEPFGPMPILLAIANEVTKLRAICVKCGNLASKTQRLINGKPAKYSDPVIMVGATEFYEARCDRCFEIIKE